MAVDLDRARSYREPRRSVAWHAWPAAFAILAAAATGVWLARAQRPDLHVTATDSLQILQVLLGLLALGHVVLNAVVYFMDRGRPTAQRLAELCSIGLSLALLLLLFASPIPFGMFLPHVTP